MTATDFTINNNNIYLKSNIQKSSIESQCDAIQSV